MTVGITFSTFDLFHTGHVAMLKEASGNCNHMIVGLQSDPSIDCAGVAGLRNRVPTRT